MDGLCEQNALTAINEAAASIQDPARAFAGRGIVICAGGERYFACAWVCINMLRRLGCRLPIQLWHLGDREFKPAMRQLVEPLDVECVDASRVREQWPSRILNGWELKPYSILHCPFREVLSLDADNVPVVNPEFLFDTPQFRETGSIFWPDFGRLERDRAVWALTGVPFRDEPEFETGQIVLDKRRCGRALGLTMWMNEHSDFWYRHVHGDKETFHMAWRKVDQPYAMPAEGIYALRATMCQHDFQGRRIFQHRNLAKWSIAENERIDGFQYEEECIEYVGELRRHLRAINGVPAWNPHHADGLAGKVITYHRVGYDTRPMLLAPDGTIADGAADLERFWSVEASPEGPRLELYGNDGLTAMLYRSQQHAWLWQGRWHRFEQMPIEVSVHRGQVLLDCLQDRTHRELRGAEIGVYRGETSALLLRRIPLLQLLMVDWWKPPRPNSEYAATGDNFATKSNEEYEQAMNEAIRATAFAEDRRLIVRAEQQLAASTIIPESLDFVFLDGDHSYSGTRAAIEVWWPKLKAGGLLCGHDFGRESPQLGVDRAVEDWSKHIGASFQLYPDFTWGMRR